MECLRLYISVLQSSFQSLLTVSQWNIFSWFVSMSITCWNAGGLLSMLPWKQSSLSLNLHIAILSILFYDLFYLHHQVICSKIIIYYLCAYFCLSMRSYTIASVCLCNEEVHLMHRGEVWGFNVWVWWPHQQPIRWSEAASQLRPIEETWKCREKKRGGCSTMETAEAPFWEQHPLVAINVSTAKAFQINQCLEMELNKVLFTKK